ncbi:type II secretion system protein J [uncultured Pseudacidovorax sp.]|uniref:PulJ/GspJ family protein n=1 Tax=uncultured Pseudacidovorax sp. TaxID=679313 RepID=UPI0025F4B276|nr:prepilin-type N-terminal cleavage/methylation domain-containing protein [uncultured Pseudacidovorax sp.]
MARPQAARRARLRGFTLVELLVALAAMALLALISWRGLESMARAQSQHGARDEAVLVLQTALAQWGADLDAAANFGNTPALDWNGRVLRITRQGTDAQGSPAARVIAWTVGLTAEGGSSWLRWQSPPLASRADWTQAWGAAAAWADSAAPGTDAAATRVLPATGWNVGYFRNGAWAVAVQAQALGTATLPDGVRLQLQLPPGPGLSGLITRDWLRPNWSAAKTS